MELRSNDVLAVDGDAFATRLVDYKLRASHLEAEAGEELGHSDGFSLHRLDLSRALLLGILPSLLLFLPLLGQLPLLGSQLDCLLRHRNFRFPNYYNS